MNNKHFFAFPAKPEQVCQTVESAIKHLNTNTPEYLSWKELNSYGSFIRNNVLNAIDTCEVLIADISVLNFNVTFEIGYAIGKGKKICLVKNASIEEQETEIREIGIFDTIGYHKYSNSEELYKFLIAVDPNVILTDPVKINHKAPVYVLEQKFKTDFANRITARIKKARYIYRSFDPNETPRLSAYDAINQVSQSLGIVVSLLSKETSGNFTHNIRAAFIAGLATGMGKALCILQHNDEPVPIDFRDFVNVYYTLNDINEHIGEFASSVAEAWQKLGENNQVNELTILQQIDFGASAAENEMRDLHSYYLRTDAFNKAIRGEVQLVVGRKGSGKSAIFLQIRDKERSKSRNVVLDLKPEGYQLIKFKELVLLSMQEGTLQHTITAFWEYILLLEICHKVLENDKKRPFSSSEQYEKYFELQRTYREEDYLIEGDFSERMSRLILKINLRYKESYGNEQNVRLDNTQITDLLYKSDILNLRNSLKDYLRFKDKIWLLFDNIDKGWPTSGIEHEDLIIIRTLIDALRSIQRNFNRERIEMYPIVFLRNDVYELLVRDTADKQKESKEMLDWIDSDLMRELIKLRILSSSEFKQDSFNELWISVCVSHYKGEETSQYLIDRSLMRPRFLINLLNQCKSFAINFNHKKIEVTDIEKGFAVYSSDLLTDINYEIQDILPEASDILYCFIDAKTQLTNDELRSILHVNGYELDQFEKLISLLLWYGFLGIKTPTQETTYIYNFNYNMKALQAIIRNRTSEIIYVVNPAFWPALLIE